MAEVETQQAAEAEKLPAAKAGKLPAAPIALARWGSLRPHLRRVTFGAGGRDYSTSFEPDMAAPAMADVVRRARLLSVQQVRRLSDPINSVDEMLFDKTLKERGLSRDDFDSKSTASSKKSDPDLMALQVWSAEHHFSEADRMTLAAHFVQQALDRNDVCHVRAASSPQLLRSPASSCGPSPSDSSMSPASPHRSSDRRAVRACRCDGTPLGRSGPTTCTRAARGACWCCWGRRPCTCSFSSSRKAGLGRRVTATTIAARRLSLCRGGGSGVGGRGRGQGRGLRFAAAGLATPIPSPGRTPRPEPTPEPPPLTAEGHR